MGRLLRLPNKLYSSLYQGRMSLAEIVRINNPCGSLSDEFPRSVPIGFRQDDFDGLLTGWGDGDKALAGACDIRNPLHSKDFCVKLERFVLILDYDGHFREC